MALHLLDLGIAPSLQWKASIHAMHALFSGKQRCGQGTRREKQEFRVFPFQEKLDWKCRFVVSLPWREFANGRGSQVFRPKHIKPFFVPPFFNHFDSVAHIYPVFFAKTDKFLVAPCCCKERLYMSLCDVSCPSGCLSVAGPPSHLPPGRKRHQKTRLDVFWSKVISIPIPASRNYKTKSLFSSCVLAPERNSPA